MPIVFITGANRGLGLETAKLLGSKGWTVICGIRSERQGHETVQNLTQNGIDAHHVHVDMSNAEKIHAAANEIRDRFGALDVLINNAAIHYDTQQRVGNPNFTVVEEAHETNLMGPWRMAVALYPLLKESLSPRIVNVSSTSGALPQMNGETPAYCLSKLALNGLTMMLANEWKSDKILVNAVCPGWCFTDMGQGGRPPSEGAKSIAWAAEIPNDGPTGGFFRDGKALDW